MKVTQNQVAERAGVTRATVSYVLSGKAEQHSITDAVVRRVREAADALGYVGHHAARALVSGKSHTIALLIGGATGAIAPFWSLIAEGVEHTAMEAGYDVLILSEDRDWGAAGLSYVRQGKADALIVLGSADDGLNAWDEEEVPPVVLDPEGASGFPTVRLEVAGAYADACAHLRKLGHRRLIWAGPAEGLDYGRGAVAARAAAGCGLECEVLRLDGEEPPFWLGRDRCVAFWRDGLKGALPDPPPATALLCWNDRAALGALDLLRRRGLSVPRDVSVVGFDDDEASVALPPLSTLGQQYHEIGEAAARLALQMVEGELTPAQARETATVVKSQFVARQSTGPAPES